MLELELAKQLSDDELIARVTRCVKEDRDVTARLLVHLGEVEARGLYRDLGFSSMFDYAVQGLHMSESEAWLRLRAARFGREFPIVIAMVARGELHMTALKLLAPVLTASNIELLDKARFKSKAEIQTLIVSYFPQPDVPSTIRKLPTPKPASEAATAPAEVQLALASSTSHPCSIGGRTAVQHGTLVAAPSAPQTSSSSSADAQLASNATRPCSDSNSSAGELGALVGAAAAIQTSSQHAMHSAAAAAASTALPTASVRTPAAQSLVPLSEGRYKVRFTATQRLVDMLNEARDLLRNQTPNGDLAVIVERALALLIAERKKQLFALPSKARGHGPSKSDAVASSTIAAAGNADHVVAHANAAHAGGAAGNASAAADNADPVAAHAGNAAAEAADNAVAASSTANAAAGATGVATDNADLAANNTNAAIDDAHAVGRNAGAATETDDGAAAAAAAAAGNAEATTPTVRADRPAPKPNSRHIAHWLRRQVYTRDAGRCCFVSRDGVQCRARGNLEFHHIVPFGRGGATTLDNICLMCRSHNALLAERDYGRELVKRRISERVTAPHARSRANSSCCERAEQR